MAVVIYALFHVTTCYAYIGCTKGKLGKRMREHRCLLNQGRHMATKMQEDWDRDGEGAFEMRVLEILPDDASVFDKRVREMYWMQQFASLDGLYNAYQNSFRPDEAARKRGVEGARAPNAERMKRLWDDPVQRAERLAKCRAGGFLGRPKIR